MHELEKSDTSIVAMKSANKGGELPAELMEPRGVTAENADPANIVRTQRRAAMSQGLAGVRKAAQERKDIKFTALLHHVDVDLLRWSYFELKRKSAPGVDGVTWDAYGENLEHHLTDLHDRVHRGAYRAQPSRRTFIPKADGRLRPLGIAALEDKVVQRAIVEVLNAIYEQDFCDFSFGFRPGRGQHDALNVLAVEIGRSKINWVLDADIRQFFDTVDHDWLLRFVEHRVADKRILRLIRKWLTAGALIDGHLEATDRGTPQGAVISPLLANIYLHYVFDLWARQWGHRQASGYMVVVRYADDVVLGFQYKGDAQRFLADLRERMAKFSLELHPDKTRLIEFGRFAASNRQQRGQKKPETFTFLGFTHICGRSRAGRFLLLRHSRSDRMVAKLKEVKIELRRRMHAPMRKTGEWLRQVVRGYFAYHAVPTNYRALSNFRYQVSRLWFKVTKRRSQRDKTNWVRFRRVVAEFLPPPRILLPWPGSRPAVTHPR